MLAGQDLGNDVGSGHPVLFGHRGAPLMGSLVEPTSLDATVAGSCQGPQKGEASTLGSFAEGLTGA